VVLTDLPGVVITVLVIAAFALSLYAFVHAALQRPDAYTAADKLTKQAWLLILGGGILAVVLFVSVFGAAIATITSGIYLVDVRPKLLEVQGKSR
jgi:uncharacterized BrkB/YihY/UPF0761 family membrane protein